MDGSTSTYWRSGSVSSNTVTWWRVDLLSPQDLGRVVVRWASNYYARRYQIQVSNNGTNWTDVFSTTSGNGGVDNIIFATANARDVRLYMTRNNQSSERVNEFEVYAPGSSFTPKITDAENLDESVEASSFVLNPGYPNPFNPSTLISYAVPMAAQVKLKIYNLAGQEVRVLVDGHHEPGGYDVTFDASGLPSGIYFSVLQAGEIRLVQRLLFMK